MDMHDHGTRHEAGSRGTVWIILLMLTLPLLYVLSLGPVAGLLANGAIPATSRPWLLKFYAPLNFTAGTPMEEPLAAYVQWWIETCRKR